MDRGLVPGQMTDEAGLGVQVDRSAGVARFEVPSLSLLELSFPTYPADQVPADLAALPVTKPGS